MPKPKAPFGGKAYRLKKRKKLLIEGGHWHRVRSLTRVGEPSYGGGGAGVYREKPSWQM